MQGRRIILVPYERIVSVLAVIRRLLYRTYTNLPSRSGETRVPSYVLWQRYQSLFPRAIVCENRVSAYVIHSYETTSPRPASVHSLRDCFGGTIGHGRCHIVPRTLDIITTFDEASILQGP
jgi:hypothetical protein